MKLRKIYSEETFAFDQQGCVKVFLKRIFGFTGVFWQRMDNGSYYDLNKEMSEEMERYYQLKLKVEK